jgi:hypothetical protein
LLFHPHQELKNLGARAISKAPEPLEKPGSAPGETSLNIDYNTD